MLGVWLRGVTCLLWLVAVWPSDALAAASPTPSPLAIRAVTVEVLPLQVGPGLSLPAPPAQRIESPPHGRTFRAVPVRGHARSTPAPDSSWREERP